MKKAMGLAFAVLATAVVATSAQGGQKVAATTPASFNCKSTITLAVHHPADRRRRIPRRRAGELGEVRRQDARPQYGLEGQARSATRRSSRARHRRWRWRRSTSPTRASSRSSGRRRRATRARSAKPFFQAGLAALSPSATHTDLTIGTGRSADRHARVLPRCSWATTSRARRMRASWSTSSRRRRSS